MNAKVKKIMFYITFAITIFMANFSVAYADANYAENGAKYFLGQLFWVAIVFTAIGIVFAAYKKSISGVITAAILGSIVCYFLKNPTSFSDIGTKLAQIIGL